MEIGLESAVLLGVNMFDTKQTNDVNQDEKKKRSDLGFDKSSLINKKSSVSEIDQKTSFRNRKKKGITFSIPTRIVKQLFSIMRLLQIRHEKTKDLSKKQEI